MARLTRDEMEAYALECIELYRNLDTGIFREIASLLKANSEQSIEEWHVIAMRQANMLNERTTEMLSNVTGRAHEDIEKTIRTAGESAISQVDLELAPILGSIQRNPNHERLIQTFTDQIFLEIDNFVNQTLITSNYGEGITTQMYQGIINDIMANFATGNMSIQRAQERAILAWADRGVSSIFIDRGGQTWSLERYVHTVLMSTLNRTYNELRMSGMRDYGVFTAVVTTLPDAAPRCQEIQGQIVDTRAPGQANSGFPSIHDFGYPDPGGPFGVNCRHMMIPYIPGVNTNNQPQYDNIAENAEARDRQRQLERRIRRSKKNIIILEELESPSLDRMKRTLAKQETELRDHVNNYRPAGVLSRHRHRERVVTPRETIIRES